MRLRAIFNSIKKLIYPSTCPLCGELLADSEDILCDDCKPAVPYISQPVCLRCGKEIEDAEKEYCLDCTRKPKSYVRGFPAMNYVSPVKESIAQFKYHNKSGYAGFYAYEIIKTHGRDIASVSPEVLVPIPVHKKKLGKRGYNQAEVLTDALGDKLGIAVDAKLIRRDINTLPQKSLDPDMRQKNLERAFILGEKKVQYKKVMLVDDIYTTGSTIEACTKLLRAAGVDEVYYTSICIGRGD